MELGRLGKVDFDAFCANGVRYIRTDGLTERLLQYFTYQFLLLKFHCLFFEQHERVCGCLMGLEGAIGSPATSNAR